VERSEYGLIEDIIPELASIKLEKTRKTSATIVNREQL
jgi:hypothetical protein